MKFRIKKLYLENFKGLTGKHTVEFGTKATFLFGPNGYGKTTIFDGLELALTGRIARIEGENNEHGGKKHEATVVHNKKDAPVILKLLVEADDVEYTIARRFSESIQKVSLDKFWDSLETYMLDSFDANLNDNSTVIEQSDVEEKLFGADNKDYLSQYFRLLTYIPQTEAIYFLKMSQSERHNRLSPLLDMSEQSNLLDSFRAYRIKLWGLKNFLEAKLKEYDDIPTNTPKETIPYSRLTHTTEISIYDQPTPFKDLGISLAKEKRVRISGELDEVKNFLDVFDPKEYAKMKKNRSLTELFKNDVFVDYLIFKPVLGEDTSKVIDDNYNLSSAIRGKNFSPKFILQHYLAKQEYEKLEAMRLSYVKYKSVVYDDADNRRSTKAMLTILSDTNNNFNAETRAKAQTYLDRLNALEKSVNSSQQLLKQLQEYRNHVISHSRRLKPNLSLDDCPLCGTSWGSEDELINSVKEKTDALQELIGNEAKSLIVFEQSINKDFLDDLVARAQAYLDKNYSLVSFFNRVRSLGQLTTDDIKNFDSLIKLSHETEKLIIQDTDIGSDLNARIEQLNEIISSVVSKVDEDVMAKFRSVGSFSFANSVRTLEESGIKLTESKLDTKQFLNLTLDALRQIEDGYRKDVNDFIQKNEVDSDAVTNSYMFKDLFSEKDELFQEAKRSYSQKQTYIDQQFSIASMESLNKYKKQYAVINPLSNKMYTLSKQFDRSLKKYQFSLTQPLKAPFYVYSAKILQNTPNGQGIFIKTDSEKSTIVFCANSTTSHDALHQLSSGQLAVVSVAFHLSMNAVYITKSLNLLIIDDPIQDMDSLNVQSFSELLRREFAKDYQIIMSTHDDLDMQYLKFMFGKALQPEELKAWNVQELFYGTKA